MMSKGCLPIKADIVDLANKVDDLNVQKQSCLQFYKKQNSEIHIMKYSNSHNYIFGPLLLVSLFLLPAVEAWSETRYVSDQLSIPMRTGNEQSKQQTSQ